MRISDLSSDVCSSDLALALAWIGVTLALRPLVQVGLDLRLRRPTDLHPVATPAPPEIQLLVDSLNRFMQRLRATMDTMPSLIAEAAHQIRTRSEESRVGNEWVSAGRYGGSPDQ